MTRNAPAGAEGALSAKVLEFERIVRETVTRAKEPGFSADDWAPLAELVDVERFERVGCWLEVMNWQEYTEFLTTWAVRTAFGSKQRRISELPGLVFLELQETNSTEEQTTVVNSLSVYEFNDAGKLRHLDIYLQHERDM
jgi:hypothetical protein